MDSNQKLTELNEEKQETPRIGSGASEIIMGKLTQRQRMFVYHYVGDCGFNATKAALKSGYSEKSASQQGAVNVANEKIKAAIDSQILIQAERIDVEVEEVVRELSKIAFPSPVAGKKQVSDNNRLRALELLAKYKGMLSQTNAIEKPPPQATDPIEIQALKVTGRIFTQILADGGDLRRLPDVVSRIIYEDGD